MAGRLSKKATIARDALYGRLSAEAQARSESHYGHAMTLGGAWSFVLKDGRTVTVEATRIGVLARDPETGLIVFRQRTDGGAHPVWFRVCVDGEYLNDDGWYGFHNPPTKVGAETDADVGRALHTIIADALGGEV